MSLLEVLEYVKSKYGTEPDFPWKDTYSGVLRAPGGKWYGIFMRVNRHKVGLKGEDFIYILNVKCDPLIVDLLSQKQGYLRAYHMNKKKWLTIILYDVANEMEIKMLIDGSYNLTTKRRNKNES